MWYRRLKMWRHGRAYTTCFLRVIPWPQRQPGFLLNGTCGRMSYRHQRSYDVLPDISRIDVGSAISRPWRLDLLQAESLANGMLHRLRPCGRHAPPFHHGAGGIGGNPPNAAGYDCIPEPGGGRLCTGLPRVQWYGSLPRELEVWFLLSISGRAFRRLHDSGNSVRPFFRGLTHGPVR